MPQQEPRTAAVVTGWIARAGMALGVLGFVVLVVTNDDLSVSLLMLGALIGFPAGVTSLILGRRRGAKEEDR